jgi:L-2-hydroxyglutarate oxidase
MHFDYCVVGGGIVGLATAMALLECRRQSSILLLEKEGRLAEHQTGHNSGVIHSGIYYAPGSLKAKLCRAGATATKHFCSEHGIPIDVCGKLIVATNALEKQRMQDLLARGKQNGIKLDLLDGNELKRLEPNVTGLGALLVHDTAIVNYKALANKIADVIRRAGGVIAFCADVDGIRETSDEVVITARERHWKCKQLIACAGLQSDRLARIAGLRIDHQIIPFRGEYYRLPPNRDRIVQRLIYPVPDPSLPFLGVHLTRMIDGGITVGPNAVIGYSREGYPKLSICFEDVREYARFPGFWKLLRNNYKSAGQEIRNSLWKRGYLEECRKYCPSLRLEDLLPERAGIRAQAVMRDGTLVHDFLFVQSARMLHVCNAPSPAATSAIPIGGEIAARCIAARAA